MSVGVREPGVNGGAETRNPRSRRGSQKSQSADARLVASIKQCAMAAG
jgi:hypothetical protein